MEVKEAGVYVVEKFLEGTWMAAGAQSIPPLIAGTSFLLSKARNYLKSSDEEE